MAVGYYSAIIFAEATAVNPLTALEVSAPINVRLVTEFAMKLESRQG